MQKALALAAFLAAGPAAAQYPDPMTQPVTPRDVRWYMGHPAETRATRQVCASNAAYALLPDCQNAKAAEYGLFARKQERDARGTARMFYDPRWWDNNAVLRETILVQCRRHGPGDELALPYCKVAGESQMRMLNR